MEDTDNKGESAIPIIAESTCAVFTVELEKTTHQISWRDIPSLKLSFTSMVDREKFRELVNEAKKAIAQGIYPERTISGSSGSYFVRASYGPILAIFKPKDEEPYGEFNPRWIKWLHRYCSPCVFGRACLMPNSGFISEAGASLVDCLFQLEMVPPTEIVQLWSPTFSWHSLLSWIGGTKSEETEKKMKVGSFQVYVEGFRPFAEVQEEVEAVLYSNKRFSAAFQRELEKLICLDYIIRNTDRTTDNWLIRVLWINTDTNEVVSTQVAPPGEVLYNISPIVKIAAIDNGLAFPWIHPSGMRSYPYSWEDLVCTLRPFSEETRAMLLPKLNDPNVWHELGNKLRLLMELDTTSTPYINKQLSIVFGQMWNLWECLKTKNSTPADLVNMPRLRVHEDTKWFKEKYGKRKNNGGFTERYDLEGERWWVREIEVSTWFSCF
jgi:phosphatidylinositol 4-kinase type 2